MRQDKSLQQTRESQKKGLLGYILIGVAISVATLAAVAYWLTAGVVTGVNKEHQDELIKVYTRQYENYFNSALGQQEQVLERIAGSESLVRLVQNGSRSEINEYAKNLETQIPYSLKVRIIKAGRGEVDASSVPPLNFAGLDMIRRAEQGQAVPVEALQMDGRPYLQMVSAVRTAGGSIIGSISLSLDINVLKQSLDNFDGTAGSITLEQKFETGPVQTLVQYGAKNANQSVTIRTNNPNWRLSFQPSDGIVKNNLLNPLSVLIPLIIVGVVLVVALMIGGTMLQTAVRNDAGDFTRYTQKLMAGHNIEAPDFRLGLFVSMAKSLARVKIARPRPGRPPEVTNPFESPVDSYGSEPSHQEIESLAPQDELLEIDMMEADQDLLGMDSEDQAPAITLPLEESIFRAYDIRGIYGETLDQHIARKIGLAIGSEAYERGEQTIVVARDGRVSSPELAKGLISGLLASGRDVVDIGMVPTPILYYGTEALGVTSGVMVTGSHNPGNYNGFKIVMAGQSLSDDEIKGLYYRINNENFLSGNGSLSQTEIGGNYINRITGDIQPKRRLKVVIDAGNGVSGGIAPRLFNSIGFDVEPLYCEVDGNFPNHHPDPGNPDNLQDLITRVKETNADVGIAFDGDGDRIGLVTPQGKIIYPDRILMLLAKDMLTRNKGATIIYDVKCSRRLQGLIVGFGGRPLMWKTGHSLIKKKMRETGALLAGEMSGHIFFKERWYGFDDGMYTAARVLEILAAGADDLDTLFSSFPDDISTPELHVDVAESDKFRIMDRLARNAVFPGANLSTIDGVRVDFSDGWGLCRASNTTPKLVLRFEADNQAALIRIQESFKQQLLSIDSSLQFPF